MRSLTNRLYGLVTGTTASRPVGVVRAIVGVALTAEGLNKFDKLPEVLDRNHVALYYFDWWPRLPADRAWLFVVAWAVFAALFALGWHTKVTGTISAAICAFYVFTDQQLFTNHTYLFVLLLVLLVLADSGASFSLDARRNGERLEVPAWPVWLLMAQLTIVYASAALAKINVSYFKGEVIRDNVSHLGLIDWPSEWRIRLFTVPLALAGVLIEATVAVALWLPRWRKLAFVLGMSLHVGISMTMMPWLGLAIFLVETLALYILFVDAPRASHKVVWDDGCGPSAKWVGLWQRLDWLGALVFIPASDKVAREQLGISDVEAATALQVVTPNGERVSGFAAVRAILDVLPLTFLWAPILVLPPISRWGERTYARVAANRRCLLPPSKAETERTKVEVGA